MYNYHNKKKFIWSIILILLLAIGIGYAYLTSNLSIAGNTSVTTNTWNIHFENLNVTTGSVTAPTAASINAAGDAITYTINLNRPKEFYEFTVDVKNDGTLPGKVSISTLNGITTDAEPIIDYTIAYTNGNTVNVGDILNAGAKKSIKVRVFYKDEIDPTDFPANDLNLTLTYTLQYVQSEEDGPLTFIDPIQQLIDNNETCLPKYDGQVTDENGRTVNSKNIYYDNCADKRNVIFGGFCWQIVRTTETGGIKMIYNGEPVGGKCESTRGTHKGIIGSNGTTDTMSEEYLYSESFTYNVATSNFTLVNPSLATWSTSTYQDLLGKFTCKNTTGTCTTMYNVNAYSNNTTAFVSSYTIGNTNYAQIGTSTYNANRFSPAMVGYMYNKVYNYVQNSNPGSNTTLMGNDVLYENGVYTLIPPEGETQLSRAKNDKNHYTCNSSTESTCSKVRYYYYGSYYLELNGEANIEEIVDSMLYSNDVNRYNSSVKGVMDSWYAQNLNSKTDLLENTVFCNNRTMSNRTTNGWNKDGSLNTYIYFKNFTSTTDMSCTNVTDQFSTTNNKAKLKYSVGLLQMEERLNISTNSLMATGSSYWGMSPVSFEDAPAYIGSNGSDGVSSIHGVYSASGVRPVVSLKSDAIISSGTGSETDPWVIE